MLPFMAYGVILLGLNLLFGYTGSSRSGTRSSSVRRVYGRLMTSIPTCGTWR